MRAFWCVFFVFWPIVAIILCAVAPGYHWWFPTESATPLGVQIDQLFYLILVIVTVVFIGTQVALGYVLFNGISKDQEKAWFTHGSHSLEVIWTIVPAGILLFVALYQMDVWAQYRIKSDASFPKSHEATVAHVMARQFEWRIRYPAPSRTFQSDAEVNDWLRNPKADDLYTVNDLHVPTGRKVIVHLSTQDVQHSFFAPELRVKQDAVPGQIIPIWFEVTQGDVYSLLCAELCGWGHYKMKARLVAESDRQYERWLHQLQKSQFDDGFQDENESGPADKE